jgi:hypothetical protein
MNAHMLSQLSELLGVSVIHVARDRPADHPSRQRWDFVAQRWAPAIEATSDQVARQRWRVRYRHHDGHEYGLSMTSDEVKHHVRQITNQRRAGRTALRLLHELLEEGQRHVSA